MGNVVWHTIHAWPWSTAPQPVGISCESILRREENLSVGRKTLGVRLRLTNNSHHTCPRQESNTGNSGGRRECELYCASLASPCMFLCTFYCLVFVLFLIFIIRIKCKYPILLELQTWLVLVAGLPKLMSLYFLSSLISIWNEWI